MQPDAFVMASRSIDIDEDALDLLEVAKRPGETLSDVVRRLARRAPSPKELVGLVPGDDADDLVQIIEENRELRLQARRRKLL